MSSGGRGAGSPVFDLRGLVTCGHILTKPKIHMSETKGIERLWSFQAV